MKIGEMYAPRKAFGEALAELGKIEPNLVVLDADVGTSTQSSIFKTSFPERYYEIGIAEQNMIGIAGGMATVGLIPFVSTFAVFASKRALDQVSISVAYPKLNVKINGAYGGIPTGKAGATHQSVEDIAIMRAMPNMTVIAPADGVETKKAVFAAAALSGPVYLRTVRCEVPTIFDENHEFKIGKSYRLREGKDIAIISTEMMTAKALSAADILYKKGVSARVIHIPTIKPLDVEEIISGSREIGLIVTVENHSMIGGLGGAVAETLCDSAPCKLKRLGFPDRFGESGDDEAIFCKYGLNVENIVQEVEEILKEKK